MGNENPKHLRIAGSVSRFLGTSVGTVAAAGKKAVGFSVRSVWKAEHLADYHT